MRYPKVSVSFTKAFNLDSQPKNRNARMKNKHLLYSAILIAMAIHLSCEKSKDNDKPTPPEVKDIPNSIEIIVDDMTLPHEEKAHGLPLHCDWALRPRVNMGNNPGDFKAMIAWGQVYEDIHGNPASNTRVQIRNIKAYILSRKDNQWHTIQDSKLVEGRAYLEDFADDVSIPAATREEADGSISIKAGNGYNFHFWTPSRASIDPSDIAGVFTTVQARLIIDNPSLPDDRANARYLLNMGGDYWLDLDAQWDYWKTNGDIGIGRFKYVKAGWQSFNMVTLTENELRNNPPPLD